MWLVTVKLSLDYVTPATRRSNAWDSRLGGALADAVSCNPVVKAFGAEDREDARFGRVLARWQTRTWVTWTRATLTGIVQQGILMVLRLAVIGLALLFWWQGAATLGDVTFVLTAYGVINGYLRDIGHHVHNVQRSTSDLEELVAFHDEPLGVENRPGAHGDDASSAATSSSTGCAFAIRRSTGRSTTAFGRASRPASASAWSDRRARASRPSSSSCSGCTTSRRPHRDRRPGHRRVTQESLRRQVAIVQQEPALFHRSLAENIAYGRPDATHGGDRARRRGLPRPTTSSRACRRAMPPWSASAASSSPAASASGWRSPAPSWPTRRSWSWTRPPRVSTASPRR